MRNNQKLTDKQEELCKYQTYIQKRENLLEQARHWYISDHAFKQGWNVLEVDILQYLKRNKQNTSWENINALLLSLIDRVKQEILDILDDDDLWERSGFSYFKSYFTDMYNEWKEIQEEQEKEYERQQQKEKKKQEELEADRIQNQYNNDLQKKLELEKIIEERKKELKKQRKQQNKYRKTYSKSWFSR